MNNRQKKMGYNAAQELLSSLGMDISDLQGDEVKKDFGLMSNTYRIIADLHTHTLASTHAYSSVTEMIRAAADKGLYAIALTDHARTMPGSPREVGTSPPSHELPLHYRGVMNLAGIEANVLDFEGHLDIEPRDIPRMDWVVASIHHLPLEGLQDPDVEKCTQLWLNVAKTPR